MTARLWFRYFVLIILRVAGLETLFLCSVGEQSGFFVSLFLIFFCQNQGFCFCFSDILSSKSQFTTRSPEWLFEDIVTFHGMQINSLTTTHGSKQLISDPTHILPQSSSCIDLIFTDQPNYVTDCGTNPSLHPNCHHQITFCKLNLKVEYPSPYQRLVWNFKKSNNDAIKKAVELVNWNFLISNKSVHEQVIIFNLKLMNIFSNYIPNKLTAVDEKDPPWMNESIKEKIMVKKYACKYFNANNKNYDVYLKLQAISIKLSEMILKRKED